MPRNKSKLARRRNKSNRPNGPSVFITRSVSSITAPAAVSLNGIKRELRFSSFNERGSVGCRVSGTFPICSLGASVTNGCGFYVKGGTRPATILLRPSDGSLSLSPILYRLASCFTRYRVDSLSFRYDPIGSTASAVRLAFCYSSDPQCPLLYAITSSSGFNTILSSNFSRAFSPWVGWSLKVFPTDSWYYLDSTASDTIAANIRQESFGMIACVADADPGVDYSYGVLSMELTLDLIDPIPVSTSVSLTSTDSKAVSVPTDTGSFESSYVPVMHSQCAGTPMMGSINTNPQLNTRALNAPSLSGVRSQ